MSALVQVHTTLASEADAVELARTLVKERFVGCAQIIPGVTSIYTWEEMLRHDSEVLLLLKTTTDTWPALRDRLSELHPYDTPEIIALPIEHVSFDYASWVRESCR